MSGRFTWNMVPQLRAVLDAFVEPGVRGIRVQKGSQGGYTESILCNLLGYIIRMCPAPILVMFPKSDKGKEFNLERFEPMVEETPCLAERVPLKSREKGITQLFKLFPGGWLKFVGSHTPDAVKSSSARYVMVEEPDDCETDVKGQGRTVKLIRERLKTYFDTFSLMGGTPTLKGLSAIEDEMDLTDKRRLYVPCHHCNVAAPLTWEQVRYDEDASQSHPVFGHALPETATYECPNCLKRWTPAEKDWNVRRSVDPAMKGKWGWIATSRFTGLAGFYMSDLISLFPGATLPELVKKYLEAVHQANTGDIKALVEFWNNQLGLAFAFKSPAPEVEKLEARCEEYAEFTIPWGGLRLTCGVDTQGDRLAIVIVAWGRGEESWRVYWGEIYGNPVDPADAVWTELESLLFRGYRHASGVDLHIEASTIDASDGNTSDAVYTFCRNHRARGVVAGKGRDTGEIFRPPQPVDPGRKSKAAKYGLHVYLIGTEKAKDLLVGYGEHGGRLSLCESHPDRVVTGGGPGRMHWYRGIRGDYFKQVTSEIKAPLKGRPRNKLYWQVKQGVRNEALDCEVYALHAARRIKVNLMSEAQWTDLEQQLRQPQLLPTSAPAAPAPTADALPALPEVPPPPPAAARPRSSAMTGFSFDNPLGGAKSDDSRPW
jgi:phage terminase large subunit GpA-like protein